MIIKELCPKCGCAQKVLAECFASPVREDRSTAWVITESCIDCKEAMKRQLLKPKLSFECLYCSAVFVDFKGLVEHSHTTHMPKFDLATEKELDDLVAMRKAGIRIGRK